MKHAKKSDFRAYDSKDSRQITNQTCSLEAAKSLGPSWPPQPADIRRLPALFPRSVTHNCYESFTFKNSLLAHEDATRPARFKKVTRAPQSSKDRGRLKLDCRYDGLVVKNKKDTEQKADIKAPNLAEGLQETQTEKPEPARLSSLFCQPTEISFAPDIFENLQSQPDGLAASKIWPANISLVRSGLLWAAYLLCLLLSGVQSPYPATSVVTVSANTAPSGDTYVNSAINCGPPLTFYGAPPFMFYYPCVAYDIDSNNVMIYSESLFRFTIAGTGFMQTSGVVLKDSLILGVTAYDSTSARFFGLYVNGLSFASNQLQTNPLATATNSLTDWPNSDFFIGVNQTPTIFIIRRIDSTTFGHANTGGAVGAFTPLILPIPSIDALLLISSSTSLPILARANFGQLQIPLYTGTARYGLVDNTNDQYAVTATTNDNKLRHFLRSTWTSDADMVHPAIGLGSFGVANNILNFGPYQYVVTIPAQGDWSYILIISKKSFTINSPVTAYIFSTASASPHHGNMANTLRMYFLMLQDLTSKNFQSYYLTVADCTSRDANRVCQACQSGLVRNNLMPDNVCVATTDYTGYVADTVNLLLSQCSGNPAAPVGVGCRATDCSGAGTTTACTTCDVANNFYLLNGVCYAYASIPDGYGIVTAGQQPLAACTDTNCLKCVANKATCTRCKDSLGYYMRTSDSTCVHTSAIADGLGANLVTYQYETCSLANCLKCAAHFQICLRCNNLAGYFMNQTTAACQHWNTAELGFGGSLVTYDYQPCTDINCLNCSSNNADCSKCNDAAGFYKNTTTNLCQLFTLAPEGYGINFTTFTIDPCADPNCKACLTDQTVCNLCKTTTNYYMNLTSGLCQLASTAADGYGIDALSSSLLTCADSNCQKCIADRATCNQCWTSLNFYMNATSGLCQSSTALTEGFGINPIGLTLEPCADSACRDCAANKDVCVKCNDTAGYFKNTTTNLCQPFVLAPDGYGANFATFTLDPCTDTNCKQCFSNINSCSLCKTASNYFMNTSTGLCQLTSLVPDGFGVNIITSTLEPCTDPSCQKCVGDKTICNQCWTSLDFYMNITSNLCQLVTATTDGYGINPISQALEPCTTPYCQKCLANNLVCTHCKYLDGYFKNLGTGLCEHFSTAADGQGANLVTLAYEPCADTNCQKCASNRLQCAQCKIGLNYYLNTTTNLCQLLSAAPDGFGVNKATYTLDACDDLHCQKCIPDKSICDQCWISQDYYKNLTSQTCQLNSTAAEGYGANLVSNNLEQCTDPNCKNCTANVAFCVKCNDTAGYFKNMTSQLCQINTSTIDGFGVNLTSFNYEPCEDVNCQQCLMNNSNCTLCNTTRNYFMNTTTNLCQLATTAADGFGSDLENSTLAECVDPHCQKCIPDKSICDQCWTSKDFYMNQTTNKCLALKNASIGFRVADKLYYEPCKDPFCEKCDLEAKTCEKCRTDKNYYMNLTSELCEIVKVQPDGFGVDPVTNAYLNCTDPNCKNCSVDYTNCTFCQTDLGFFMNTSNSTCQSNETMSPGYRMNETSGLYEKCTLAHCTRCDAGRSLCNACDVGNGFSLVGGRCSQSVSRSSVQQFTKFLASTSKGTVTFADSFNIDTSWGDQLDIMLLDLNANKSYLNQSLFKFAPKGNGFEITILLEAYIQRARLYISKKDPPVARRLLQIADIPDKIFPVIIDNFTLLNEATQKAISAATGAAVDSMDKQRAVANIVLMNVNMNAATLLDRIIADYEYQALIGKQNLTYTRLLLDPALEVRLAPFELPGTDEETKEGFIERKNAYTDCKLEYFYFRNNVNCGFLQNYGSDFITLIVILMFTILVTLFGNWLRKKKYLDDDIKEPFKDDPIKVVLKYQLNMLACKLTITFGLQFFFVKMEANALKLLLFGLINIYKMDDSWQMGIGFMVSVIVLLYYGAYLYLAWAFARNLKEAIVSHAKDKQSSGTFRPGPLKNSLKLHEIRFGFIGKPYEELRNDLNFFEIYYPVVLILRDISIALCVVMLTSRPYVTPILTAIVEIGLLGYSLLSRARAKKLENTLDVFTCCTRIIYSILAALTFRYINLPPWLDIAMFLTLLINTVGSLFISICIVILSLYDILVLLFKRSSHEGRFKSSEDRIGEKFGKTFLAYRKEILGALQRYPDKMNDRIEKVNSRVPSLKGLNSSEQIKEKEFCNNTESAKEQVTDNNFGPLDSPLSFPIQVTDANCHEEDTGKKIEDNFLFSGRHQPLHPPEADTSAKL